MIIKKKTVSSLDFTPHKAELIPKIEFIIYFKNIQINIFCRKLSKISVKIIECIELRYWELLRINLFLYIQYASTQIFCLKSVCVLYTRSYDFRLMASGDKCVD